MSSGFISEKDVEERRRVRQEEWDKNRGDDDPLEAPEEPPHDPRSLYDRLQEQRQKKQDEYDEAHKFKNMVRGLEDDEVDFLELVDRTKLQEEKRVRTEEHSAMLEYRKKVSAMQKSAAEDEIRAEMKAGEKKGAGPRKASHVTLLAGAIKRKASDDARPTQDPSAKKEKTDVVAGGGFQCVAVLPGLGVYTDSSDSDNAVDSDSDEEEPVSQVPSQPRDITGRVVAVKQAQSGGQQQCS